MLRSCILSLLTIVCISAADPAPAIPYPLTTCIVNGSDLGSEGQPVTFIHEGREIKLCCKGCLRKFQKDPGKFLAKLPVSASASGSAYATAPAKP